MLAALLQSKRCLALVLSQPINLWGKLGQKVWICFILSYHQRYPTPAASCNAGSNWLGLGHLISRSNLFKAFMLQCWLFNGINAMLKIVIVDLTIPCKENGRSYLEKYVNN